MYLSPFGILRREFQTEEQKLILISSMNDLVVRGFRLKITFIENMKEYLVFLSAIPCTRII